MSVAQIVTAGRFFARAMGMQPGAGAVSADWESFPVGGCFRPARRWRTDVRFTELRESVFQRGADVGLRFSGTHCGTPPERIGKINAETRSSQRREEGRNKKKPSTACEFNEARDIRRWRVPAGGVRTHSA